MAANGDLSGRTIRADREIRTICPTGDEIWPQYPVSMDPRGRTSSERSETGAAGKGTDALNSTTLRQHQHPRERTSPNRSDRTLAIAARFAIALAVIYAIPHIWWGLGIDWLAPGDMRGDEGLGSNPAITFFAFYGMGALALLSAVFTWDMTRSGTSRFPAWFLALHGWGIGILLLIRGGIGLAETSLVLTGVRDCPFLGCGASEPGRDSIGMTGVFWEPLFVTWGVALLTIGVLWSRTRALS